MDLSKDPKTIQALSLYGETISPEQYEELWKFLIVSQKIGDKDIPPEIQASIEAKVMSKIGKISLSISDENIEDANEKDIINLVFRPIIESSKECLLDERIAKIKRPLFKEMGVNYDKGANQTIDFLNWLADNIPDNENLMGILSK